MRKNLGIQKLPKDDHFHSNQPQSGCPPQDIITGKVGSRDDVLPFLGFPTSTCYSQAEIDMSKHVHYSARTGDIVKETLFFFSLEALSLSFQQLNNLYLLIYFI